MEIYKNWQIRKSDYASGYYEATNLNDCDAFMKHAKSIEEIKVEIDNELLEQALKGAGFMELNVYYGNKEPNEALKKAAEKYKRKRNL